MSEKVNYYPPQTARSCLAVAPWYEISSKFEISFARATVKTVVQYSTILRPVLL